MKKNKLLAGVLVLSLSLSFVAKESYAEDINNQSVIDLEAEIIQKKKNLDQEMNFTIRRHPFRDDVNQVITSLRTRLEAAKSLEEIKAIEAQHTRLADIYKNQKEYAKLIEGYKYLSNDEKQEFLNELYQKEVIDQMKEVEKRAGIKDHSNKLTKAKTRLKNDLEKMTHWSDEERAEFLRKIDAAFNYSLIPPIESSMWEEKTIDEKKVESIDFEIEIIYDNDLEKDKEIVVQEGENGERILTISTTYKGFGVKNTVESEEITKNPTKKIIKIGTKDLELEAFKTSKKDLEDKLASSLDKNKILKDQYYGLLEKIENSKNKEDLFEIEIEFENILKLNKSKKESMEELNALKNLSNDEINIYKEKIASAIKIDDVNHILDKARNLNDKNEKLELLESTKAKTISEIESLTHREADKKELYIKQIKESTRPSEILAILAKAKEDRIDQTSEEIEIPFSTERQEDENLEEGKEEIIQKGQSGIRKITTTTTHKNGKDPEVDRQTELIREPITEIVKVGIKKAPIESEKIETSEEIIPFETKTIYDESLEKGKEIVDQEGQDGNKTITHTIKLVDSKEVSRTTTEEITKKPIDKIVRIGTKKPYKTLDKDESKSQDDIEKDKEDISKSHKITKVETKSSPRESTPSKQRNTPTNNLKNEKSDLVYIPKGHKYIKEGYYKRSDLIAKMLRLERALTRNQILVKAVNYLFEMTPKTIRGVRVELENLIEKSERLIVEANRALEELKTILN